jgi:DNA repair exonuclease SbcCD ATPase subunit
MHVNFAPIGQAHSPHSGENSFWPSFTDIMMVITMIFLMATSLLVVRNWQLVAELRESLAAEQIAAQLIESTSQENATLDERLANAEQSNSILRLRLMKKDEELKLSSEALRQQESNIVALEIENIDVKESLQQANTAIKTANLEVEKITTDYQDLQSQLTTLQAQLRQQELENEQAKTELGSAKNEIETLTRSSQNQQEKITSLEQEKILQDREIAAYNRQLLALKGDYEVVKSKYDDLIKPARSAKGKFIAEVYYIKGQNGKVIRYRQPGYPEFVNLPLAEVEKRLTKLKAEKGDDLYVKIIIPQNSGLSYNEAWDFMRNLLVKYDYYYQGK